MPPSPPIGPELRDLIEEGEVAMWLATAGAAQWPEPVRAMGARVDGDWTTVTFFLPTAQLGSTAANVAVRSNGSAVVCRVTDYRCIQLKGVVTGVRDAEDGERGLLEAYSRRFAVGSQKVGLSAELVLRMTYWPATAVSLRVATVFSQTPGPGAGAPWAG